MKVAIIGCGNIAATHAQVLNEMGMELAVVVDKDMRAAVGFAGKWNAAAASDDEDNALMADVVHIFKQFPLASRSAALSGAGSGVQVLGHIIMRDFTALGTFQHQ